MSIFPWNHRDCHLWYTSVKLFFGLLGGSKGKKWPNMTRDSDHRILYLRNHTSYDLDLWYTCVTG